MRPNCQKKINLFLDSHSSSLLLSLNTLALSGSLSHILAHSGPLSGFLRRSLAHKVLARPTTSWLRGHSLSLTIRVLYCAGVGLFCVSHRFRNLASNFALGVLGAVHFVLDRGEGSSRFITLLHRGGALQSLSQYYRFGRNMEGFK